MNISNLCDISSHAEGDFYLWRVNTPRLLGTVKACRTTSNDLSVNVNFEEISATTLKNLFFMLKQLGSIDRHIIGTCQQFVRASDLMSINVSEKLINQASKMISLSAEQVEILKCFYYSLRAQQQHNIQCDLSGYRHQLKRLAIPVFALQVAAFVASKREFNYHDFNTLLNTHYIQTY